MTTDTLRQITGVLRTPEGSAFPNKTLTWFRERRVVQAQGSSVVLDEPFYVVTDAAGAIDHDVMAGNYLLLVRLKDTDRYFRVSVPDQAGPFNIADLVDAPPVTPEIISQVQALVIKARAWAENPEDTPVETGPDQFSALHHSRKASASAAAAALYDGPWLDTVSALLADTALTYTTGQPETVTAGGIVRTRAEGFSYAVAPSGATDHHVTTAGGVKLYVLPIASDFYASAFGIVGVSPAGSPFDERAKIATAFQAAGVVAGATGGISIVHFEPDRIYGITNLARRDCVLPAGVGFDLHGSMITRIGGVINVPMIENDNTGVLGGPPTRDHQIRNGKLRGTGAVGATTDQGSALLLWESVGTSFIENIETIDTNGDGLQFRNAKVVMRDIVIGDYGRNGISPTSGDFIYENVRITGNAITGADPGIALDAENNSEGEFGRHLFINCDLPGATFVDFWAPADTPFRQEVVFLSGRIGGQFGGLRFLSENPTIAEKVYIGPGVQIDATGTNGSCVTVRRVSGIITEGTTFDVGAATGSPNAFRLTGKVHDMQIVNPRIRGAFSSSILSTDDGAIVTPLECERLQGFPDGYTDVPYRKRNWTPDGPRYKALGNSMAVNAMDWLGQRIEYVRAVLAEQERKS